MGMSSWGRRRGWSWRSEHCYRLAEMWPERGPVPVADRVHTYAIFRVRFNPPSLPLSLLFGQWLLRFGQRHVHISELVCGFASAWPNHSHGAAVGVSRQRECEGKGWGLSCLIMRLVMLIVIFAHWRCSFGAPLATSRCFNLHIFIWVRRAWLLNAPRHPAG